MFGTHDCWIRARPVAVSCWLLLLTLAMQFRNRKALRGLHIRKQRLLRPSASVVGPPPGRRLERPAERHLNRVVVRHQPWRRAAPSRATAPYQSGRRAEGLGHSRKRGPGRRPSCRPSAGSSRSRLVVDPHLLTCALCSSTNKQSCLCVCVCRSREREKQKKQKTSKGQRGLAGSECCERHLCCGGDKSRAQEHRCHFRAKGDPSLSQCSMWPTALVSEATSAPVVARFA